LFSDTGSSGLDIGYYQIEEQAKALGATVDVNTRTLNDIRFSPLNVVLIKHGRLGRKSG
jgi:hypothetical protein